MSRKWQIALLALSVAGLFFLVGFFRQYHLPKIERWILVEVERQSTLHLPVRVWPQAANLSFFPPSIVLHDVRLLPQKELASLMAPTEIKTAIVRINWLYLLTGKIRLSYVGVSDLELKLIVNAPKTQPKKDPWDQLKTVLALTAETPIDEINVEGLSLWVKIKEAGIALHTKNLHLNAENLVRSLLIDLEAPTAEIKWEGTRDPIPLSLGFKALMEANKIQLSSFKSRVGNSFLVAAGDVGRETTLKSRLQVDLSEVKRIEELIRKPQIPKLTGVIKIDVDGTGRPEELRLVGKATGSGVTVAGRVVGDIGGEFDWERGQLKLQRFGVANSAGKLMVKQMTWQPEAEGKFSAKIDAESLELGRLLKNLHLPEVPIHLDIKGGASCEGVASAKFEAKCEAEAHAKDLVVRTVDKPIKTIVEVPAAFAKGKVEINTEAVTYAADLQVGESSRGRSTGKIEYRKGFKIDFQGDEVAIGDIKNLADLKLEGSAKLKGSTEGDAHSATLMINLDAKDIWLDNFWLGDPTGEVSYKKGTLAFRKMVGQVGSSRYNGQVNIDLPRKQISIQARSPYVDIGDVATVFSRHLKIPFDLSGTGTAEVNASGPLKFNELSYHLDSNFYRGAIAKEGYDQIAFKVSASNGHVKTDQVQIRRGQSTVDLNGRINPAGVIDAVMVGRKLRLEESELVSELGLDLTGQLDFTTEIRGQLPHPTFDSHGRLSRMVIADKAADDSTFKIKYQSDRIEGGGSFIGDVVVLDFNYPLTPTNPFRFKAKATKWNFANLFSLLSSSARQRDFLTSLSGRIELTADKGDWNKLNGSLAVEELRIQRGAIGVANVSPINLSVQNSSLSGRPFAIEGEGGYLRMSLAELNRAKINATVNGKIDLSLLTLLTPFLADLQGRLALNISLSGSSNDPRAAGSAYIEQGVIRFKEFPHAFTNLRSDVIFSEKGAVINSVRAELGGGTLTGLGKIRLASRTSIPVDIKGQFSDVTLNVPEGFKSKGSGTWSMSGDFFPYTIAIGYEINSGEVTADFGQGAGDSQTISPSKLLPKALIEKSHQPIRLDLTVNIKDSLPIRNDLLNCQVKGKVHIVGPPNDVRLTGTINPVPGGGVYFRDVPFEIQTGFVEFQDDPPENAKIYLTAQTRKKEIVRDEANPNNPNAEKENQYEISLMVQGRPKQRKITLSSMPPLTEKEIVSLLALGMTPSALESNRSAGQLAASNSVQIGTAILQRPLSKEARARLGVDVQISQTNNETGSYPKFTINKQFTPKFGVSASRTFEKNPTNSAKMEYKVNRSFSIVGSWEGKESTTQDQEKVVNDSILGLDLEYKVNFK